ncbi:hypothetical protein [Methanoculleus sp.]|jgi:uncharacterized protein YxjI|uniref:hypothetical protein n=1 Tax=Methanoculleus sp. TaxID=90427 RepID=UPI00320C7AD1
MRRRTAGAPGGREEGAHRYRRRETMLRARDTCGVEAAPGQDDALILLATAAIDRMAHD